MLKKFVHIRQVGKFANCANKGDLEMRPLTLIYGENARGKTTLCGVLRSLTTSDSSYLSERHTFGASSDVDVKILADDGIKQCKNGSWDNGYPNIVVFDTTFVHENVFSGECVDHAHKKNLHRVIVGKQGVQLNQRVSDLDAQSRDLGKDIRALKAEVENFIPNGVSIDKFLGITQEADLEARLAAAQSEVTSLQRSGEIAKKSKLSTVSLPELPSDLTKVLLTQLDDVTADAEATLNRHIQDHTNSATEQWLSDGLTFLKDPNCPFCGQEASELPLVKTYQSYFSRSYKELKTQIARVKSDVTSSFGELSLSNFAATISNNSALLDFWQDFVEIKDSPVADADQWQLRLSSLGNEATKLCDVKAAKPLDRLIPGDEFNDALAAIDEVKTAVAAYNEAVNKANELIQSRKDATDTSKTQEKQAALALLEAEKKRFEPQVVAKCDEYVTATDDKKQVDSDKKAAKEKLDEYSRQVFGKYRNRINDLLSDFNTSFQIGDLTSQYKGGQPSTSYDFIIKNQRVSVGDSDTPRGTPRFSTTLSAGDRSTLALAFFIAQTEMEPAYQDCIIVFDDPFTSQDRFRRTRTQQLICDKANDCRQVIVLSHDPHFLKLIYDNYESSKIKTLQLTRVGANDATITEWDIEAATRSAYCKNYYDIEAYIHRNVGEPIDVARKIRPVLEGYLRVRFPTEFPEGRWLGQLIEQIRDADGDSPLTAMQGEQQKQLEDINGFSKAFHHETNPTGYSSTIPDEAELVAFAKKTVRFIGGF